MTLTMKSKSAGLLLLATAVGCAPALEADDVDDGLAEIGEVGPNTVNEEQDDGSIVSRVDASDQSAWIYLDLDTGTQLDVSDPRIDPDWELGFQRFNIKVNGGVSGTAGTEVSIVQGTAFAELEVAPGEGYLVDEPDGDDDNQDPDYVFGGWYDYNFMTHVLTPFDYVYVVRNVDGQHFKVQIEDYYDDAGSSGHLSFRWQSVDAP